jgi:hypothetical protein
MDINKFNSLNYSDENHYGNDDNEFIEQEDDNYTVDHVRKIEESFGSEDEIPSTSKIYPMKDDMELEDVYEQEEENEFNALNPNFKTATDEFNNALKLAFRNHCVVKWVTGKCNRENCRWDHSAQCAQFCLDAAKHLYKRELSELLDPKLGYGIVKEINNTFNGPKKTSYGPSNVKTPYLTSRGPSTPAPRVGPQPTPFVPRNLQNNVARGNTSH